MLRAVTPYTARSFSRAIVMPNTDPPITSQEMAMAYRSEIFDALPPNSNFEPLMTYYLTRTLTPAEIERGAVEALGTKVYGVKYYPWGATTNSQWGYKNILEAKEVLKEMERAGMPLLLHGEVHLDEHGGEVDPYQGEQSFVGHVLPALLDAYPKLKVSLEHVSTKEAADFLEKNGKEGRLVGTVTVHHLLYTLQEAGQDAMLKVKPLIKTSADKEAIRALVAKGLPFISAGTDSAPHPESKKRSPSGAFGIFSAPVAVELYTQIFEELGALDKLENFLSVNGPKFYALEPSEEKITLQKKGWRFSTKIITDDRDTVAPLQANQTIPWQMKK